MCWQDYWFRYPTYPCLYCQFSAEGDSTAAGTFVAEFTNQCFSGYRCEWEILVYPSSGQLTNFTVGLQLLTNTQNRKPLPLNTPVALSLTDYYASYQFTLLQLCVVNLTVLAANTSADFELIVSRSDRPTDFTLSVSPAEQTSASQMFSPDTPYYSSNQSNVGSPFIANYRLFVYRNFNGDAANFTLTLATSPYTNPSYVLQPLALNLSQPFEQQIDVQLQQAYWYYSCQMPPAASAAVVDLMFSVLTVNPSGDQQSGSLSIWWSTVYQTPSDIGYTFNDTCSTGLSGGTCIFSQTNGNALRPGQTVFFGLRWDSGGSSPVYVSALCNALPRLTLTAQGTTGWQRGPVVQGYAVVVDLALPSPASASSVSFVAGVATSASPAALLSPLMFASASTVGGTPGKLPDWSSVFDYGGNTNREPLTPIPDVYTAGSYLRRTMDLCAPNQNGCLYHFLLFFPEPVESWQLVISDLTVTVARAAQPANATVLVPGVGTGPLTVGVGQVQLFNFSLPVQLMTTAQVTVTLTPLDGGNPDLFVASADENSRWVEPLPLNNRGPPGDYDKYYAQSINVVGLDSIYVDVSNETFAASSYYWEVSDVTFLSTQWQVAVVGTTAATFSLLVTVSGEPPANDSLGYLAITPQQSGSASITIPRPASKPYIWTLVLPPSYTSTSDLLVSVLVDGNTRQGLTLTALQYWPILQQYSYLYFPASSWLGASGTAGVSLMINSNTWPSVGSGSVVYVLVWANVWSGQFTLTSSLQPRVSLPLLQPLSGSMAAGDARTFNFSVPAIRVGGSWLTSASFLAAVSITNGTQAATTSPLWLAVTRADNYSIATFNPYGNANTAYLSQVRATSSQMVTVNDVCTTSQCTWMATLYAQSHCSFTFQFSALPATQRLIPGLSTTSSLPTATAAYYSFLLPHSLMSATFYLQSAAGASAALLVSPLFPNPDVSHNTLQLATSVDSLYQTASLDSDTPLPASTSFNGTWYVAVFAQAGGRYSLLVELQDAGVRSLYLTNNQPVAATVTAGTSNYYQFNIGQVSATTDLSLVLSSNSSAAPLPPSLYATFSYTHPGPEADGYLPPFLPYEMFSTNASSSGLQQLTLTQTLSSSNVLPLVAQSTLYVAVWGGATTEGVAPAVASYVLSISLSTRIFLTLSSPGTSLTLTRVDAGSVQYFQWSFLSNSAAGQQALLVWTGLTSAVSALPSVYIANPTISAVVDPVVSISSSYTSSLQPASTPSTSSIPLNAMMVVLPADCALFSLSSQCVYKSMVYSAQPISEYAFALTTYNVGDQQQLPSNASVEQSVQAGQLLFFTFIIAADVNAFNLSLLTNNADGNADLFLSNSNAHPYPGTSQWSSCTDPLLTGTYIDSVSISSTDTAWQAGGRYYVSVFGQRAASFALQLTLIGPPAVLPMPSPSTAKSTSSSSSIGLAVSLAVLLPIIGLLLLALIVQRRRGLRSSKAASDGGAVDVQMSTRQWGDSEGSVGGEEWMTANPVEG